MNTCTLIKIRARNRSVTCWWKIGTCENGTGLVSAVLKGLKQRVRARNDGTRLTSVGINSHYKSIHELTGALLDPDQVRLAKIKEVEFLHTFPVHEKVCESELKGTEFVLTRWILTDKRTWQATRHSCTVCWSIVQVEFASNRKLNCSRASSRYHWNSFCHSSKRKGVCGGHQSFHEENGNFTCWMYHVRISAQLSTRAVHTAADCRQQVRTRWKTVTTAVRNARRSQCMGRVLQHSCDEQGHLTGLSSPCFYVREWRCTKRRTEASRAVAELSCWTKHGRRISLQRATRVKQGDPALPTVSCGSVGWSHARRAMVAHRSTQWLDLTCWLPSSWFCLRATSVPICFDELGPGGRIDVSDVIFWPRSTTHRLVARNLWTECEGACGHDTWRQETWQLRWNVVECEWSNILQIVNDEVGVLLQQTSQCLWGADLRDTCDAHARGVDSTEDMCAMTSSDQADSSHEWWHMRCPTLKTWKVFYICVFDPTDVTFLSIILWKLVVSRSKRAKWHFKTLDTKLAWESWSDNETNDQLLNFVHARSKYLHYSKIKDNL